MKRTVATLLMATAFTGVWGAAPARAEPVSTFFAAIGTGFAAGSSVVLGSVAATATGWGFAVGQFLAANLGTLVLAAGSLFLSMFNNQRAESSQVNFRQATPVRAHVAGLEHVGGAVLFASFDNAGAFWYVIGHCDSELMEHHETRLDDVVIATNASNQVTTDEFIAESSGFLGFGSRKPFYSYWLCTFGVLNPVPPLPQAFKDAFPEWTENHRLAGITVSVIKIDPVKQEDRHGVYRWRGPIGLGEPAVSVVGVWGRIYDPQDSEQNPDNRSTWKASTNAALIWAWNRYRPQGFNMAMERINWAKVSEAAAVCDDPVLDRYGDSAPRYSGGGFYEENLENIAVEQDILKGMDGVTLFDDEGRAYCVPGHWRAPALRLTASRDIFSMSDNEANDGESATDGVIVRYKDASLGYVMQPCAPWHNPDFYVEGTEPKYLTIDVPFCKNHNQAVRLAKANGRRAQPRRRIAPEVGIRGIRAKRERIIQLDYDDTINGVWQIAVPVEIDPIGTRAALGLVPATPNDWTLLPGEEGAKPEASQVDLDDSIDQPTGVVLFSAAIAGTGGASARIETTFNAPARETDVVEAQYRRDGSGNWLPMTVITDVTFGYSDPVDIGWTHYVQFRTRRGSHTTPWSSPVTLVIAVDTTAPGDTTGVSATDGAGQVTFDWIAPSGNYAGTRLYLSATDEYKKSGDSGSGSWTRIGDLRSLATVQRNRIVGRVSPGAGEAEDLTGAQVSALLGIGEVFDQTTLASNWDAISRSGWYRSPSTNIGEAVDLSPLQRLTKAGHFTSASRNSYLSDLQREMTFKIGVGRAKSLNDKIRFAQELEGIASIPRSLGYLDGSFVGADWERSSTEFIVKPATGGGGTGIFRARVIDGVIKRRGREDLRLADFKAELLRTERSYIFQELIEQHDFLKTIYSGTVNTVRVLMARDERGPFIAICVLRVGGAESVEVDNFSRGGTSFFVDHQTGRIGGGKCKDGTWWESYADTGVPVTGHQLPYWDEVSALCFDAMSHFSRLEYVGWDVVVSNDGPYLLEGNSMSDVNLLQVHRRLLADERMRAFYASKGILDVLPTGRSRYARLEPSRTRHGVSEYRSYGHDLMVALDAVTDGIWRLSFEHCVKGCLSGRLFPPTISGVFHSPREFRERARGCA